MSLVNPKHALSNERIAVRFDIQRGVYSLYDILKNQFVIESAAIAIEAPSTSSNRIILKTGRDFVADAEASSAVDGILTIVYRHPKFPLGLTLTASLDKDDPLAFSIKVVFHNLGPKPVGIRTIFPLWVDPAEDSVFDLGGVWSRGAMLRNGVHSASESSIEHFSKPDGTVYDSYCFTLFHHLFSRRNVAVGFTTLSNQFATIAAVPETDGMHLYAACHCDDVRVEPGADLVSETLWMRVTDTQNEQLSRYAQISADANHARPCPLDKTPVGWSTRHSPNGACTAEYVKNNLAWMAKGKLLKLDYLLVDDGWQKCIGDWIDVDTDRFPEGMAGVAAAIHAKGLKAGIWLAPFLAVRTSKLFSEHPTWFLRDANAKPLTVLDRNSVPCHILDCANDEVIEHVSQTIKTITQEWGFDHLNLDCLHHVSSELAVRATKTYTLAQVYRRGIDAIREAAGENVFLLGSSAPLGPSVGVLDACRISYNSKPIWMTPGVGDGIGPTSRNTLIRSILNGKWFYNDADCLEVRFAEGETELTHDEFETAETVAGISGMELVFSDHLPSLTEDEINAVRFMLPPLSAQAVAPDPMTRNVQPNTFMISDQDRRVIAVFNWSDAPERITLNLADLGLKKESAHVIYDVKACKLLSSFVQREWAGQIMPPHSVKVFHIVPAPNGDKPVLIGSTFHIGQGIREITHCDWSRNSMELDINVASWIDRSGSLTFYAPSVVNARMAHFDGVGDAGVFLENNGHGKTMQITLSDIKSENVKVSLTLMSQ